MDTFTEAYLEALLWSETDEAGNPLDKSYGIDDISKGSLKYIVLECEKIPKRKRGIAFRSLWCEG